MGLLTEKYIAWAKHPQKYTAEQVLNQIVADLKWLDEEQAKNCSIPAVVGRSEQFISLIRELIDVGIIDEDDIEVETWVNNYLKEIN